STLNQQLTVGKNQRFARLNDFNRIRFVHLIPDATVTSPSGAEKGRKKGQRPDEKTWDHQSSESGRNHFLCQSCTKRSIKLRAGDEALTFGLENRSIGRLDKR